MVKKINSVSLGDVWYYANDVDSVDYFEVKPTKVGARAVSIFDPSISVTVEEIINDTDYKLAGNELLENGLVNRIRLHGTHLWVSNINEKVIEWADERGIVKPENKLTQFAKLVEEVGELSAGINKHDVEKIIDSMGDIQVVLIILAADLGIDYSGSLQSAYGVIKDRKGKTNSDGAFVKEEDLK